MRRLIRLLVAPAAALALGTMVLPHVPVTARQTTPRTIAAGDLRADRLRSIADAVGRGLDHVPGEVLVRFRRGVSIAGQARALRGLRSRPVPGSLRWLGDTAHLRDPSEPDPAILVRQLRLQPEVE